MSSSSVSLVDVFMDAHAGAVRRPGGSPYNVAVALGRLGVQVTLLTSLGDDADGRLLREHAASSDVSLVAHPVERTVTATVTLDEAGEPLADSTRRGIFERLAEHPRTVGELAGELPVSRPAVSQHLKVLKSAGLVQDEALGTRRVYAVNPRGLDSVREYFDRFWRQSLSAFAAAAHTDHTTKEDR